MAELAGEGFGWGGQFVKSPRDAVDALAAQLGDALVLDDVGRRCVTRDVARRLLAERDEVERRQREVQQRHEADLVALAELNRPRGGVPADQIPEGILPVVAMTQAAKDAEPRRQSVLEHALANDGGIVYHPVDREES